MRVRELIGFLVVTAAAVVAGCAAGGETRPPSVTSASAPTTAPVSYGSASLTFRLDGVTAAAASSKRRTPSFLSPATASLTVNIATVAGSVAAPGYPVTVALSLTSGVCTSSQLSYSCQIAVPAVTAGVAYTATLTTKDASGSVLSQVTTTFTLTANTGNVIGLTLAGVPTSILVASASTSVVGNAASGLTLYGSAAQPITVNAVDADGDLIIGPGAPTFTVTPASAGWTAATPAPTTPNTILITPPGHNGSAAGFNVTASSAACSLAAAVCTAYFTVRNDIQTLFVMDTPGGAVRAYTLPLFALSAPTTITTGITSPQAIAVDPSGDLYVANGSGSITGYAPPYTGSPFVTISGFVGLIAGIAFDGYGHLFVASIGLSSPVTVIREFQPPAATVVLETITLSGSLTYSLATDTLGYLYITGTSPAEYQRYEPLPQGGLLNVNDFITASQYQSGSNFVNPTFLTTDPRRDVFIVDSGLGILDLFTNDVSSTYGQPVLTGLPSGAPVIASATGTVFVASSSSSVAVLAPPYTAGAFATLTTGISRSFAFAVDGTGTFYAANASSFITAYAPPYTGAPVQLDSPGIASNVTASSTGFAPYSLAVTP